MKHRLHFLLIALLIIFVRQFADSQTLQPPQNFSVKTGFLGGAVLKWDTSAGAAGYVIYKSVDGSPYGRIAIVHRVGYSDWYVFPGFMYRYFVTAVNMMMVESQPSDTVMFSLGHHHYPLPGEGIIAGKIKDVLTGEPLQDAVVRFFQPGKLWAEETHTDTGGIYWAALDTGKYLIRADKFDYIGEWFDNVLHVDSATVVNLHQDSITFANFDLHPIPIPTKVNVSGTVVDSSTGQPIPNAFVAFLRPHRWLRQLEIMTGIFGGLPLERFDLPFFGRLHGVVWMGFTDINGNYTSHLPRGLRYIAFAFKPGYVPVFFNNKYTPLAADRLQFMNDTSGINFSLLSNPLATNTLSGTVVDSTGGGIPSHVILFRKVGLDRVPVRFSMTDSIGNFSFNHLVDGIFYIKTVPVDGYAPAWFSRVECGVRNWRFADTIHVGSDISGIEVCVKPSPRLGFARIAGVVGRGQGNLLAVTPEQAVTVYAISTTTNEIVGYDVTEDDGSYSIENLPEGSYTIVADKEGAMASNVPAVTVDGSNNYEVTGASVILTNEPLSVGEGVNQLPLVYRLNQNYPNPFNPSTQIRFDLPKMSIVTLKIYNLIGQEVATLVNGILDAGKHTASWNAQQAGSGIYFVKIVATSNDGSLKPFSQVRKMILMK